MGRVHDLKTTLYEALGFRRFSIFGSASFIAVVLSFAYSWLTSVMTALPPIPVTGFVAIAFFAILALVLLVYANDLRRRLSPQLDLFYSPTAPFYVALEHSWTQTLDGGFTVQTPSRWFRIRVHNPEPAVPIEGVTVSIVRIEYQGASGFFDTEFSTPQRLRWTESTEDVYGERNIAHLSPLLVDVVSLDEVQNRVNVKWEGDWIANAKIFNVSGVYRLTIAAVPRIGEGRTIRLLLNWQGNWATAEVTSAS